MTTFNRDELEHIAHLSALKLEEQEIELFIKQIKQVLTYVDQLTEVTVSQQVFPVRNSNVLREDLAIKTNSKPILALAPQADDGYFSVPKILDDK